MFEMAGLKSEMITLPFIMKYMGQQTQLDSMTQDHFSSGFKEDQGVPPSWDFILK